MEEKSFRAPALPPQAGWALALAAAGVAVAAFVHRIRSGAG